MKKIRVVILTIVAAALSLLVLQAQPTSTVQRKVVYKQDMSIPGHEGVMALVELPPGAAEGPHTHHAEVFVFLLEGEITLENEGHPTTVLRAGDVFHIAPGAVHQAINNGAITAKLAAVFVAEKGKPLTTQVPPPAK
jgi:quercetin dioxygenase-like cupin family protein